MTRRPMAGPAADPDAMSVLELLGAAIVAIEIIAVLFAACLFLPAVMGPGA